jgi:uncharacterized membrane protein
MTETQIATAVMAFVLFAVALYGAVSSYRALIKKQKALAPLLGVVAQKTEDSYGPRPKKKVK